MQEPGACTLVVAMENWEELFLPELYQQQFDEVQNWPDRNDKVSKVNKDAFYGFHYFLNSGRPKSTCFMESVFWLGL